MTDQHIQIWTAETVLQTLNDHSQTLYDLGVRKIGLFGSYARGDQKPDSDLDFLVVLANHSFDMYFDVKEYLDKLFTCEIDLVEETGLKPRIRPYVMQEVIYAERLQSIS